MHLGAGEEAYAFDPDDDVTHRERERVGDSMNIMMIRDDDDDDDDDNDDALSS
jgi:hypothetical protein